MENFRGSKAAQINYNNFEVAVTEDTGQTLNPAEFLSITPQ
ncbi:MAG: hypothetical protein Ct9H300mP2_2290 [Candidatus Neomarinimicrobiota bacterium]|nr:MAG: hypothetical protein Ct9H300mP2_2290 [Candidatus Neomarinimicrobiota bacterium]